MPPLGGVAFKWLIENWQVLLKELFATVKE